MYDYLIEAIYSIDTHIISITALIVSIISAGISIFALLVYYRNSQKVDPRIITVKQYVDERTGRFMMVAEVTNIGRRVAENCSVHIYIQDNLIAELEHVLVESQFGKISEEWPAPNTFDILPLTPIKVRHRIDERYVGQDAQVYLIHDGRRIFWNTICLTHPEHMRDNREAN